MSAPLADTGLPIEDVMSEVVGALGHKGLAVLSAEPGAGKTTVVPLRLLEAGWLDGTILVLEPRRVAARAVARRMASMLGESVGETVGWRTRDDAKVGRNTRIEVVTEGILTRRLQRDPTLPGVAVVIFDEFHERSIHADLGLALILEARSDLRPDLRLLVMSATIDTDAVAAHLGDGAAAAPAITCPGRTFPVDIRWRPVKPPSSGRAGRRPKRPRPGGQFSKELQAGVIAAVDEALAEPGDVLVFLPGMGEIRRVVDELRRRHDHLVLPLYGSLSSEEQDAALRADPNHRRIICATDVAETSLTVDGIGSVVDAGLARRPRYDPATGLSKLVTVSHSQASADQRAGRSGRLGPGVAIRLWSKLEQASRAKHEKAEIFNIDLTSVVLEALAWGVGSPLQLRFLDPPPEAAVNEAIEVLIMLGAIDPDGRINEAGRSMLALPLHPRHAAMMYGVGDGPLAWPAVVLAAMLSERDVLAGRPSERPVDLWTRVQLVVRRDFDSPCPIDSMALSIVRRRADELAHRVGISRSDISPADLGRCLAMAYPDRLAQRRASRSSSGTSGRYRLRNGMGAHIDGTDPLAHEQWLAIAEMAGDKKDPAVRLAAGIDGIDIEFGFTNAIEEKRFFGWDPEQDDLTSRVERRLGALELGGVGEQIVPSDDTTHALIDRICDTQLGVLAWSEPIRRLQSRMVFAARTAPELEGVKVDDDALIDGAEGIFGPFLHGATGRRDLERLDLKAILESLISWDQRQIFEQRFPAEIEVGDRRPVPIDYSTNPPTVSMRAQSAYAFDVHPTVGGSPLRVELLSPADRPIQVTTDLIGFWEGSWSEVRKDMAGRYPKHDWPADPQRP